MNIEVRFTKKGSPSATDSWSNFSNTLYVNDLDVSRKIEITNGSVVDERDSDIPDRAQYYGVFIDVPNVYYNCRKGHNMITISYKAPIFSQLTYIGNDIRKNEGKYNSCECEFSVTNTGAVFSAYLPDDGEDPITISYGIPVKAMIWGAEREFNVSIDTTISYKA